MSQSDRFYGLETIALGHPTDSINKHQTHSNILLQRGLTSAPSFPIGFNFPIVFVFYGASDGG